MPVIIKLNRLKSGKEFFMNMSTIYSIEGDETGTRIWDKDGDAVYVKESPEEIDRLIDEQIHYLIWRE